MPSEWAQAKAKEFYENHADDFPGWCDGIDSLAALLDSVREERDKEWAAALDPLNVGTDYGEFLADPKRAALLLKERAALDRADTLAEVRSFMEKLNAGAMQHSHGLLWTRDKILAELKRLEEK